MGKINLDTGGSSSDEGIVVKEEFVPDTHYVTAVHSEPQSCLVPEETVRKEKKKKKSKERPANYIPIAINEESSIPGSKKKKDERELGHLNEESPIASENGVVKGKNKSKKERANNDVPIATEDSSTD